MATIYRSAEAPTRRGAEKSASESAGSQRGAEESAHKVLRAPSPALFSAEAGTSKHLFQRFPRHPVWGRHLPKHSFRSFSWSGLRHCLDGRHSRKDGGFKKIPRTSEGLCPAFSGFSQVLSYPSGKWRQRREKVQRGRTKAYGEEGRTPLHIYSTRSANRPLPKSLTM